MSQKVLDWEGESVPQINEIWMPARIENQSKSCWISRSKFRKIVKQTLPKMMFLSIAFFWRFWEGLGRVLGRFWEGIWSLLAFPWRFFCFFFLSLCAQEGLRGPKRRPRALLSSIWVGFGGVLGGVWEDLGGQNWGFSGFFCTCRLRWHKTA